MGSDLSSKYFKSLIVRMLYLLITLRCGPRELLEVSSNVVIIHSIELESFNDSVVKKRYLLQNLQ